MSQANQFADIKEYAELVDYSLSYRLGDFNCGINDYNDFLVNDAPDYLREDICQIKLLINRKNADIINFYVMVGIGHRREYE